MSKRILSSGWLLGTLLFLLCQGYAQDRIPVQAELVRAIDAGRVKIGESVLAKVAVKWQNAQCTLREGAVLKGRIVAQTAHSKTEKNSQIALLFESAQCNGPGLEPLLLTVAAVLASDPYQDRNLYENQPLSEAVGLSVGGGGGGAAGVGVGGGVTNSNMRSVTAAAATVYVSPQKYKGPTAVMPGQVVGIRGLKLRVGDGPEGSSVLSMSGHNVRLESGYQIMLVPNLTTATVPNSAGPSAVPTVAEAPIAKLTAPDESSPPDETEVCLPPQCTVAFEPDEAEAGRAAAWESFPVSQLGYAPARPDQEMYSFDYGSAMSYLGAGELLFTFNPHVLIERSGVEAKFAKLRVIRAVLINVQERKVEKTVDWKVADAQQYLWPVSEGVLVHVGRELRLYRAGLKLEQRLVLNGPLAFVRTSPSSKYFAVGVLQERHSEAIHRELEEAEQREPEEDVEIKVLDSNFRTLATVVRSSRATIPVLSDIGEIRVLSTTRNRWSIVEESWDEQKRVLARLNSGCRPQATSLPPDLLFVAGCDRQSSGKWYRVIRPNGRPLLRGVSPSVELQQTVSGVAAGNSFAIGVAQTAKSMAANSAFQTSDLQSERIAVYRAENGERIFTVTIPSPEPTVQTFVLSPDGGQLAVLQKDQIAFYKVPTVRGHQ
jgi:hypothetical protein